MTAANTHQLRVRALRHAYGPTVVLDNVALRVPAGRTVALVGPSGCGKTTLLHLCAGLLEVQEGRITQPFAPTAVMFQQPRLLPWMAVLDNIALALKAQGVDKRQRHAQARQMALALGLPELSLAQYPAELSGGMQSRVALARALVLAPKLLLMDEPFSALDPLIRQKLQQQVLDLQARLNKTIVFITHDIEEAMLMGSRIAMLNAGRLVQVGTPAELRHHPADDYVAEFMQSAR